MEVTQALVGATSLTSKSPLDLHLPLRCLGGKEFGGLGNFMHKEVDLGNDTEGQKENRRNLKRNSHAPCRNPSKATLITAVKQAYEVLGLV